MSERTSARPRSTAKQEPAAPVAPAAAAWIFGTPARGRAVRRPAGRRRGHPGPIGPREVPRLWERHVLNSAAVAEAVPQGARVVDVGSGAGLPGIPLGLARPDLTMTLVEPMARRVEFLEEAVAELRGRRRRRAVPAGGSSAAAPRTGAWWRPCGRRRHRPCRGAAPRLVGWCRNLMRPGTQLVALVGARALELPALLPELTAAGMRDVHPRAVGAALGDAGHYRGGHDAEHGDEPRAQPRPSVPRGTGTATRSVPRET